MVNLIWGCVFLLMLLFVVSLVLVQSMTNYRIEHDDCASTDECTFMRTEFGTVRDGMITLFQCTTGGTDWGDVFAIIKLCHLGATIAFIMYIIFFNFAFFNIITSMYVDKAMKLAKPDE